MWGYRDNPAVASVEQIRKYVNQSTRGFKVSGFQMELVTVNKPSSLIHATGSGATRAADDYVIDGTNFLDRWNPLEGTWYIEYIPRDPQITNALFEASDGTTTERMFSALSSAYFLFVSDYGGLQAQVSATPHNAGVINRAALSYKSADFQGGLNGVAGTPVTSGRVPTVNKIKIGLRESGTGQLNGHIKRFLYWGIHSDDL